MGKIFGYHHNKNEGQIIAEVKEDIKRKYNLRKPTDNIRFEVFEHLTQE